MRSSIGATAAMLCLCLAKSAFASTHFSQDFQGPLSSTESISGDFHVDRGVLVTSNPYSNGDTATYQAQVDLSAASSAYLSFGLNYFTEGCCDPLIIRVSGPTGLNAEVASFRGIGSETPIIDLTPFTGAVVNLIFDFTSDSSVTGNGLELDNLLVSSARTQAALPSFDPLSAAPEPGAWVLLLSGVGGIGFVLRRRKAAAAFVDAHAAESHS